MAQLEDITPPQVVHFEVFPTTIDTSVGPRTLDAIVEMRDDLSGLDSTLGAVFLLVGASLPPQSVLIMKFGDESPLCELFDGEACMDWLPRHSEIQVSDDGRMLRHAFPFEFLQCFEPLGRVPIRISITDKAGNRSDFSEEDLAALGFPSHVEVTQTPIDACRDLPDLTATPVRFKFKTADDGDHLVVGLQVENNGTDPALTPFTVALSLLDHEEPLAVETVPSLGVERSIDVILRAANLPPIVGQTAVITIDGANQIVEQNEQNNRLFFTIGAAALQPGD